MGSGTERYAGKSLAPGDVTEDGWTYVEGGYLCFDALPGADATSPFGWRVVRPPRNAAGTQDGVTWAWLAENWETVSTDLHAVFGVDVADRDIMRSRSWSWLRSRIGALLNRRTVTKWLSYSSEDRQRIVDREMAAPWC